LLVEGVLDVVNQAPIVDAGPAQGIELGGAAELNGSVTDDGRPTPGALTVSWSAVSGPGLVTFADSTQPRTQARFGAPGTYLLHLTASDGALSSFDDVRSWSTQPTWRWSSARDPISRRPSGHDDNSTAAS
jgi:hypothetical protein